MKMFADDTKLWTRISSEADGQTLQADLDSLSQWSENWLLKFNPAKCKVMHIGHSVKTKYYMTEGSDKIALQEVSEEKDLGVFFTDNLKPSVQCARAAAKARSILAMVKRHFRRLDKPSFLLVYKTYIRPHMEFCVQAWAPFLKKDIECLESVQKTATKLVPHLKHLPYCQRLEELGLTTLEERRSRGDLIETYKLMTGKEKVSAMQFFSLHSGNYNTRGHNLKLEKQRSRLNQRHNFFSQRVVGRWNSLTQHTIDSTTTNSFKNRLDSSRYEH
jgi:ribonucleases P/MRP protein subunit RPP40